MTLIIWAGRSPLDTQCDPHDRRGQLQDDYLYIIITRYDMLYVQQMVVYYLLWCNTSLFHDSLARCPQYNPFRLVCLVAAWHNQ